MKPKKLKPLKLKDFDFCMFKNSGKRKRSASVLKPRKRLLDYREKPKKLKNAKESLKKRLRLSDLD